MIIYDDTLRVTPMNIHLTNIKQTHPASYLMTCKETYF